MVDAPWNSVYDLSGGDRETTGRLKLRIYAYINMIDGWSSLQVRILLLLNHFKLARMVRADGRERPATLQRRYAMRPLDCSEKVAIEKGL